MRDLKRARQLCKCKSQRQFHVDHQEEYKYIFPGELEWACQVFRPAPKKKSDG